MTLRTGVCGTLVVATLWTSSTHAQCNPDNIITITTDGEASIQGASCQPDSIELRSSLASAKGAYANALQILSPAMGTNSCSLDGNTDNCVAYTGDCTSCGNDPNAYPGELTCWCQPPASRRKDQHPDLASGGTIVLHSQLLSDQNVDGSHSGEPTLFSAKSQNSGSEQQRTYVLHPELIRQDWEDKFNSGDGDFNDFVALTDARICGKLPFPIGTINAEAQAGCAFDCATNFDPNCGTHIVSSSNLRFHFGIGIDSSTSEADREPRGRAIHLTVTTYGTGTLAGRRLAVCPTLFFAPAGSATATDPIVKMNYGTVGSQACTPSPANHGIPSCSAPILPKDFGPFNVYPVAFARGQTYAPSLSCQSRDVDDTFIFNDDNVCSGAAATSYSENYEVYLGELDQQLLNTNERFSGASFADLRSRLQFINVDVVIDPPDTFFCPVGVNAAFGAINFGTIGYAFEESQTPAGNNVVIYERR